MGGAYRSLVAVFRDSVAWRTQRIAITNRALQTASVRSVIERAPFDAERGVDDPDVTVLDIGHPLVRRLIEEVKQNAFRETQHYGRTSYLVTPDADEVSALFHLLTVSWCPRPLLRLGLRMRCERP